MRELHQRLAAIGHVCTSDADDVYAEGTVAVVEAFQRSRGLPIVGNVDATTWSRLLEAGWRLGDRLLYLSRPFLRGDDVAELQVRLAQLGFNPGRIDGIFGPLLDAALSDFQRNCAIDVSGTLSAHTLHELRRLTTLAASSSLVTDARDIAGFNVNASRLVIVCGASPLTRMLADEIGDELDVQCLDDEPEVVAAAANSRDASVVVSLEQLERITGAHVHYWASYRSRSVQGEDLAGRIVAGAQALGYANDLLVTGMALTILRETRMTTLHIEHGDQPIEDLRVLVTAISKAIVEVIHR